MRSHSTEIHQLSLARESDEQTFAKSTNVCSSPSGNISDQCVVQESILKCIHSGAEGRVDIIKRVGSMPQWQVRMLAGTFYEA
jgi:hypothetical protein